MHVRRHGLSDRGLRVPSDSQLKGFGALDFWIQDHRLVGLGEERASGKALATTKTARLESISRGSGR